MSVMPPLVFALLLMSPLVAAAQPAPPSPPAPPRPPIGARTQTDQTVAVQKGARLELDDCAGEVMVKTWGRDEVRVLARHSSRTRVRVETHGQVVSIDPDAERGRAVADFELTVPAWINLNIEGHSCFMDVDGVGGTVSVETVEGDMTLRNIIGTVDASSIQGAIVVEGGKGRVEVSTVESGITISKAAGEIVAESVEGDITITNSQPSAIEVSTVEGGISYSGPLQSSGRYFFTTHEGDVVLTLPENTSATFGVRSFQGDITIDSALPLKQGASGRRGQRRIFTLGGGAAEVEIESFEGTIQIRRPGQKD
jgi:DUF4097 and DUF4098 domain-containing protein YvlB